jgi:hypothetical protein
MAEKFEGLAPAPAWPPATSSANRRPDTGDGQLAYVLRAKAESLGSLDFSPMWCGQNASGCKEITAAQLACELAADL